MAFVCQLLAADARAAADVQDYVPGALLQAEELDASLSQIGLDVYDSRACVYWRITSLCTCLLRFRCSTRFWVNEVVPFLEGIGSPVLSYSFFFYLFPLIFIDFLVFS